MSQSSLSSLSNLTHLLAICNAADSSIILSCPGQLLGSSPLFFLFSLNPQSCFIHILLLPCPNNIFKSTFSYSVSAWSLGLHLSSGVLQVPPPSSPDTPIFAICLKYSWYDFSVFWLLAFLIKLKLIVFEFEDLHLIFLYHILLFPCYFWHSNLSLFLPLPPFNVFIYVSCHILHFDLGNFWV